MHYRQIAWTVIFLSSIALGDDAAQGAKVVGSWVQEGSKDPTVVIAQDNNKLRLTRSDADHKGISFECDTVGRDCETKDNGKKATISFWFNGPNLVVLETRGSEVTETTYRPSADGITLDVNVSPVSPPGKPETLHLKRMNAPGSAPLAANNR